MKPAYFQFVPLETSVMFLKNAQICSIYTSKVHKFSREKTPGPPINGIFSHNNRSP